jgi:two-component system, NarL family, response regulator NreC
LLSLPLVTSVRRMSIPAALSVPADAPGCGPARGTGPVRGAGHVQGADDVARGAITIVLADDHQVVRSGLRMLLEAEDGLEVLGEAGDVTSALREVLDHRPRVLVLDLNMSGESSLSAIPQLRRESPGTQVVVLTMQDEVAFAREALRAGALGYVLKDAAEAELVRAVRSAAEGQTYLNPRLRSRLTAEPLRPAGAPGRLSPRELEVLKLIALGHTNGEIAATLYLSVRTVESHRSHIQQKTGRTTRAELVGYARENELVA